MFINGKMVDLTSIVWGGINFQDAEACQPYIASAEFTDGTSLQDYELSKLEDCFPNKKGWDNLFF